MSDPPVDNHRRPASLSYSKYLSRTKEGKDGDTGSAHVDASGPQELSSGRPFLWCAERGDGDGEVGASAADLFQGRREEFARWAERNSKGHESCWRRDCSREFSGEGTGDEGSLGHMSDDIARDRDRAISLLHEWVQNEGLRQHAYAVEASLRAYASALGEDPDVWGCVGLLHDFDWERHPTLDQHPQDGEPILAGLGYPEWFRRAILSHADHLNVTRETLLEKHLYACDELPSFIHACARVRPQGFDGLEPKSVKKKLKQPSFAAGVNREDVADGAELIGRDLDDHIRFVIGALTPIAGVLGLPPANG